MCWGGTASSPILISREAVELAGHGDLVPSPWVKHCDGMVGGWGESALPGLLLLWGYTEPPLQACQTGVLHQHSMLMISHCLYYGSASERHPCTETPTVLGAVCYLLGVLQ